MLGGGSIRESLVDVQQESRDHDAGLLQLVFLLWQPVASPQFTVNDFFRMDPLQY